MNGGRWGPLLLVAILLTPASASAQPPAPRARNLHARAPEAGDTTLALENVRLYVPAGAVAGGTVIGLGVGGVPGPEGATGPTGVVVTAAGGFRAPLVVLIALSVVDRAAIAGQTPALVDTAGGGREPCVPAGPWIACPARRPGAYVVGATTDPLPSDQLLHRALATLPVDQRRTSRPLALVIGVILGAGLAGGAAALLLGRRGAGSG